MPFLGSKAIENRRAFYSRLQQLLGCFEGQRNYLAMLCDIVQEVSSSAVLRCLRSCDQCAVVVMVHAPRLELLRGILGVDPRWSHGVMINTMRVVTNAASSHGVTERLSPNIAPVEPTEEMPTLEL